MSSDVVIRRRRFSVVGLLLFALFVAALVLHTLFDRLTPYTSEATLQAPVVGVAPNISGTIISVAVQDNQPVHAGERLLRIDPQRFEAAVKQAEANLSDATQRVGASTAALAAAAAKSAMQREISSMNGRRRSAPCSSWRGSLRLARRPTWPDLD